MGKEGLSQTTVSLSFLICKVKIIVKHAEVVKIQAASPFGSMVAGIGHCLL